MIGCFLLIFFFLILFSFSFGVTFGKEWKDTIPFSFFFIMLWMYVWGMYNLQVAFFSLLVCFLCFLCYAIYKIRHNFKTVLKQYINDPTLWLYFCIFLVIVLFNFNKHIAYIDEYKHWGSVVKAMWNSHQLSFHMDYIMYPSYPPAISLLQYTFMSICGTFSESILYITFYLFGASLILPFLKLTKKNFFLSLFFVLAVPTVLFISYYNCIYVDGLLGVLFAYIMVWMMQRIKKGMSRFDLANLVLALITLTLLKDIGLFFSLIALAYWAICIKVKKIGKWETFFMLASAVVLSRLSWSICLSLFHTPLQHQNAISFEQILNLITLQWTETQIGIISKFFTSFFQLKIVTSPVFLDYISIIILLILVAYGIYQKQKLKYSKKLKYFNILMISGAIAYPIGLLLMYLFQFDTYEAIRLSSYERYIVIFMNGVFIAFMILIFTQLKTRREHIIFICIFCLFVPYNQVLNWIDQRENKLEEEWYQVGELAKKYDVMIFDPLLLETEQGQVRYYLNITSKENLNHITFEEIFDQTKIDRYEYIYFRQVPDSLEGKVQKSKIYQVKKDGQLILVN